MIAKDIERIDDFLRGAERVLVIGSPGSGKTCFSDCVGEAISLPVVRLDDEYWRENWVRPERNDFVQTIRTIIGAERWILDGDYSAFILDERRLAADRLIFVDAPMPICLLRVLKRYAKVALGCSDSLPKRISTSSSSMSKRLHVDLAFLWYVAVYRSKNALTRREVAASKNPQDIVIDWQLAKKYARNKNFK